MQVQGIIIQVCPIQSGVSRSTGTPWMAQTYILETREQRPRKLAFDVFGEDKIKAMNIQCSEELNVSFDIDARESQGRWYNSIRAWRVDRITPSVIAPTPTATQPAANDTSFIDILTTDPNDFPF